MTKLLNELTIGSPRRFREDTEIEVGIGQGCVESGDEDDEDEDEDEDGADEDEDEERPPITPPPQVAIHDQATKQSSN